MMQLLFTPSCSSDPILLLLCLVHTALRLAGTGYLSTLRWKNPRGTRRQAVYAGVYDQVWSKTLATRVDGDQHGVRIEKIGEL
jgi:hypothetical protein